jgi:hypothetical protein
MPDRTQKKPANKGASPCQVGARLARDILSARPAGQPPHTNYDLLLETTGEPIPVTVPTRSLRSYSTLKCELLRHGILLAIDSIDLRRRSKAAETFDNLLRYTMAWGATP